MPYEKRCKDDNAGKQVSTFGSRTTASYLKMRTLPPALEARLPELFTVASADTEALTPPGTRLVETLPDFTVIHKRDWYIKESYAPDLAKEDQSFLAKCCQHHFNEQPS